MSPRQKFVLIFLIFSIPFVGSTIAFLFWTPTKTNNYGELLSPVMTLPETKLSYINADGADKVIAERALRGKWLMLTRDSGACEAACQKKLYAMRQARLVIGREQDRVLRVILVDDDVIPTAALQKQFAGTIWISAKSSSWIAKLPSVSAKISAHEKAKSENDSNSASNAADAIYGVDTIGNIFIRYSADPDIKRMSADFQKVLKASQIG